jgi:nitroreductase
MDAFVKILSRRSVRRYEPTAVPKDLLLRVLDAGRLAPTASNEQPWYFVVVTDAERLRQIAALTDHGRFLADAPAGIVVLCKPTKYYLEDGCAATTQMMLAATALGLGTCWIAGDKKNYAAQVVALCGAPADCKLVSIISIGYAAEVPAPHKRSLDEVAHWDRF